MHNSVPVSGIAFPLLSRNHRFRKDAESGFMSGQLSISQPFIIRHGVEGNSRELVVLFFHQQKTNQNSFVQTNCFPTVCTLFCSLRKNKPAYELMYNGNANFLYTSKNNDSPNGGQVQTGFDNLYCHFQEKAFHSPAASRLHTSFSCYRFGPFFI